MPRTDRPTGARPAAHKPGAQHLGTHHLRPQTLRERLCHLFHRTPATRVPHWDILTPEDLPAFDLEAEWALLVPSVTRLAVDEAHGDVADRLVEPRVAAYQHTIDRLLAEQQSVLAIYRQQGAAHLVRLSEQVDALRRERAAHAERVAHAWEALCGTPPAEPVARERAVPVSTEAVLAIAEVAPVAPVASAPLSLTEPEPEPEATPEVPEESGTPTPYLRPTRLRPVPAEPMDAVAVDAWEEPR